MTISRCDIARLMLRDVFATWDDWRAELGTVTGFVWEDYEALYARISEDCDPVLSYDDEAMLKQAADQFFGYPAIRTSNLEAALGKDWKQHLIKAIRGGHDS